jgi:myo-inositol 2-dehydrogenase/D-chiro-inositol 1-dehydrogenase
MRIGLVGVGRIGAFHARNLSQLSVVEELVLADVDASRAAEAARELGARFVDDVGELFGAGLDGLVIAAPTDAHGDLLVHAIQADLPVFCEKPVASDIDETLRVLDLANERQARVHIGFQRRFDAGYTAARAAVADGSIGWVHTLRGVTADPAPPPAAYIKSSGGIFKDCSVHDFDIIRWVTGREIVEVCASGSNRGEPFFTEYGDVDTGAALLRLDDDALALVSVTRYNGAGYDVRLEVLGSQSSVSVGLDDRSPLRSAEAGVDWPGGPGYAGFMDRFQDAYLRELEAFTQFVLGDIESPCTIADALEATYVAVACELSRREQRTIAMDRARR